MLPKGEEGVVRTACFKYRVRILGLAGDGCCEAVLRSEVVGCVVDDSCVCCA
jgi:hypothetical protein